MTFNTSWRDTLWQTWFTGKSTICNRFSQLENSILLISQLAMFDIGGYLEFGDLMTFYSQQSNQTSHSDVMQSSPALELETGPHISQFLLGFGVSNRLLNHMKPISVIYIYIYIHIYNYIYIYIMKFEGYQNEFLQIQTLTYCYPYTPQCPGIPTSGAHLPACRSPFLRNAIHDVLTKMSPNSGNSHTR